MTYLLFPSSLHSNFLSEKLFLTKIPKISFFHHYVPCSFKKKKKGLQNTGYINMLYFFQLIVYFFHLNLSSIKIETLFFIHTENLSAWNLGAHIILYVLNKYLLNKACRGSRLYSLQGCPLFAEEHVSY